LPQVLDRPWDLDTLTVPFDDFCVAEWHVIASGPCSAGSSACPKRQGDFEWTGVKGTADEHAKISAAVDSAAKYTAAGGLSTWTGAFMCGAYNHPAKGYMTVEEQAGFAAFYTQTLEKRGIPWAVLATAHFIDETVKGGGWNASMLPLRDALLA
jgi:hypothetical protein